MKKRFVRRAQPIQRRRPSPSHSPTPAPPSRWFRRPPRRLKKAAAKPGPITGRLESGFQGDQPSQRPTAHRRQGSAPPGNIQIQKGRDRPGMSLASTATPPPDQIDQVTGQKGGPEQRQPDAAGARRRRRGQAICTRRDTNSDQGRRWRSICSASRRRSAPKTGDTWSGPPTIREVRMQSNWTMIRERRPPEANLFEQHRRLLPVSRKTQLHDSPDYRPSLPLRTLIR